MIGELRSVSPSGSLCVGCGDQHNTVAYSMHMKAEEATRVDSIYTDWQRKGGINMSTEKEGYVYYWRESTGNWIGPLPPPSTLVYVNSPTGYTEDVTITVIETGKVYRSQID